jgi:hypothetical protein
MGLHTRFHKRKDLYDEQKSLYEKLDKHDAGIEFLDDLELYQIQSRADEISDLNDAQCHDLFRTNKRESDGTYTLDILYSKEQCYKWVKENEAYVYNNDYQDSLKRFWDTYPDGVIDFG